MKYARGVLYVLTALVTGGWELYLMLRPMAGGPWSWWYPITFTASVLLLIAGLVSFVSGIKSGRVVALTGSLVLAGWWVPATVHSVRVYFSPKGPTSDPRELLWVLVPILLVLASLVAGALPFSNQNTAPGAG
jgi:hypothetical protein